MWFMSFNVILFVVFEKVKVFVKFNECFVKYFFRSCKFFFVEVYVNYILNDGFWFFKDIFEFEMLSFFFIVIFFDSQFYV